MKLFKSKLKIWIYLYDINGIYQKYDSYHGKNYKRFTSIKNGRNHGLDIRIYEINKK